MEIYTADHIENYGGDYYKADEAEAEIAKIVKERKKAWDDNIIKDVEINKLKEELMYYNINILPEKDRQLCEKDAEIAMLKKRANELECEISTLDLIISRQDAKTAELNRVIHDLKIMYNNIIEGYQMELTATY